MIKKIDLTRAEIFRVDPMLASLYDGRTFWIGEKIGRVGSSSTG